MPRHNPVLLVDDIGTRGAGPRVVLLLAVLAALAWLSVAIDGFRWGLGNNALQAPILQRAVDPALFPGDPFVATLDKYTSAVWWLLAQVGRALEIREWEPIIYVLHLGSRVLFLAGIAAVLGVYVRDRRVLLASVAVVALGASLRGPSVVGVHGLMGRVPDHTALATSVALFAIAAALRGRHVPAAVFAALAFDINAFVGVWLVPVVIVTLYATRPERGGTRKAWLGAGAFYAVLTAPVALWVFSAVAAPDVAGAQPFDYRAFLYSYFPKHFFIDSAARDDLRLLATVGLTGVAAVVVLGPEARGLRACYASWVALFLTGAAAPYLTSHPSVLNLHLLRMDAFLMILAVVAAAACAAAVIEERRSERDAVGAAVATLAGVATGYWWVTLAGVGVVGTILRRRSRWTPALLVVTLAAAAASVWVVYDNVGGSRGMAIAATLALVGSFAATGAPAAAAFALATVCSRTQQPKAAAAAFVALAIWSMPLLDVSRRRLLVLAVLIGIALLALVRVTTPEHRLMLGFVIAALLIEPVIRRATTTRSVPARFRVAGYASLVGLVAFCGAVELLRSGPRDPFAAEIAAWREVQGWARANTGVDVVFAVPDWPDGFGVWSERSIWVDWKHGAAVMWDPSYYPVYRDRRRLQTEATDPSAFTRATGVCFAVAKVSAPRETFSRFDVLGAGLPVAFRNDRFAVIDLCPHRPRPTRQTSLRFPTAAPNDT